MNKFKFGDKVLNSDGVLGVVTNEIDGLCFIAWTCHELDEGWYRESELTPASDWVKCSERMPETYTKVLVLVEVGNDSKQHIFVDELYESTKYGMTWQNNDNLVTHWMPLPDRPTEVER